MSVPDTHEIEQQSHAIVTQATAIAITCNDDLETAATFLRSVKTMQKRVEDTFDGPIKAAHAAHKAMLDAKKQFSEPLERAERAVKVKISTYQTEQERLRREEELRLQAEARRVEEERRLAQAVELEAAGQSVAAAAVLEAPAPIAVPVVPRQVPKIAGVSSRKLWKYRIVNPALIPREWMTPNDKAIADYARRMQASASIPGVEFYPDDVVSASGF